MEKDVEKTYYERVKNYIALKPKSTKIEVSSYTRVPIEVVEKFIEEGRFEECGGILRKARKMSKSLQRENELRKNFLKQMHYDVQPLNIEDTDKTSDSKLVNDLKEKYGPKDPADDWIL